MEQSAASPVQPAARKTHPAPEHSTSGVAFRQEVAPSHQQFSSDEEDPGPLLPSADVDDEAGPDVVPAEEPELAMVAWEDEDDVEDENNVDDVDGDDDDDDDAEDPARLVLPPRDEEASAEEVCGSAPEEEVPPTTRAPLAQVPSSQRWSPAQSASALHGWTHRPARKTSPSGQVMHEPKASHVSGAATAHAA